MNKEGEFEQALEKENLVEFKNGEIRMESRSLGRSTKNMRC